MIKSLFQLTLISLSFAFLNFSDLVKDAKAQTEIKPNLVADITNLGDLPNDPQQMLSWKCVNGNKAIAVEVKDVDNWQKMLDSQSWSCQEDLSVIPGESGKFSCTPQEDIGILTVVWLQGEGGNEQMQTWFDSLSKNQKMVCYKTRTNKFWY